MGAVVREVGLQYTYDCSRFMDFRISNLLNNTSDTSGLICVALHEETIFSIFTCQHYEIFHVLKSLSGF